MVARQPPHLRGTADMYMCMHMHGALQDMDCPTVAAALLYIRCVAMLAGPLTRL